MHADRSPHSVTTRRGHLKGTSDRCRAHTAAPCHNTVRTGLWQKQTETRHVLGLQPLHMPQPVTRAQGNPSSRSSTAAVAKHGSLHRAPLPTGAILSVADPVMERAPAGASCAQSHLTTRHVRQQFPERQGPGGPQNRKFARIMASLQTWSCTRVG